VPAAIDVGKRLTPTLYLTEAWLPEVCSKTAQKGNWGIPQTKRVKRKLSISIFSALPAVLSKNQSHYEISGLESDADGFGSTV
jgi:hypothetical protein